jgi:hypothetical protein
MQMATRTCFYGQGQNIDSNISLLFRIRLLEIFQDKHTLLIHNKTTERTTQSPGGPGDPSIPISLYYRIRELNF